MRDCRVQLLQFQGIFRLRANDSTLGAMRMANSVAVISTELHAKLKAARVARLCTLDAKRRPYLVPICFAWDGSIFYSAIDNKPKRRHATELARMKNVKEMPEVVLLIDHYDEDWTSLWYVLVRGEAEIVSAAAEQKRAIQSLRDKYPQYDSKMLADSAPVLRIRPVGVSAWGKV